MSNDLIIELGYCIEYHSIHPKSYSPSDEWSDEMVERSPKNDLSKLCLVFKPNLIPNLNLSKTVAKPKPNYSRLDQ